MKMRLEESESERLRVLFSMNVGSRIWSFCFGSAFTIVGLVFLVGSLPHTEFLRWERSLERITCTGGQRFRDSWTIGEKTVTMKPGTLASIEEVEDEGQINYKMVVRGLDGDLYFGKTKGDRYEAERIVQEINSQLHHGFDTRFEWKEDVWWWWFTPFALLAIAVGISVIGLALCTNVWVFDRLRGEAWRATRCVVPLRSTRWLLQDIAGCKRERRKDADGDVTYNCAIMLRAGQSIQMSTVSYPLQNTEHLDHIVARINDFLGTSS